MNENTNLVTAEVDNRCTQVAEGVRNQWKIKFKQGDQKRIAELAGVSRNTISLIMRTGYGKPSIIKALNSYYQIQAK
jgi:predicted XRE-type DNA-binding protein